MFEVVSYEETATCTLCDKDANLIVKCKLGTLHGPLCTKCLVRQCKARKTVKGSDQPSLFPKQA